VRVSRHCYRSNACAGGEILDAAFADARCLLPLALAKMTPMTPMTPKRTLDTKGLKCPLPVLKARRAMKELAAGDVLEVLATDPGALKDFRAFCETTGDTLLASRQEGEVYVFHIRKAA